MRHGGMGRIWDVGWSGALLLGALSHGGVCDAQEPVFSVASVKVLAADAPRVPLYSGGPGSSDPGRLHLRVNMSGLLSAAFSAYGDQIKGPAWLRDYSAMPFYDLSATMPPDSDKEKVEKMLQSLLVERFHLAFHRETASFPGYELVLDPGGSRLKPLSLKPSGADNSQAAKSASGTGADGFPDLPGPRMMGFRVGVAHQRVKFQEWSINSVAVQLGFLIGRAQGKSVDDGSSQPRVINKTGLEGIYTFILEYDCPGCEPLTATSSNAPDGINAPAPVAKELGGFPDIFGAVQKELGLRLVKTADVPREIIVVDQVDKIPTEN